jgi:predicted kinase/dephospho-CoA kinase
MSLQNQKPVRSNRPQLVIFCGLPGSGKTTLGRQLERQLPAVRLCPDEWMAELGIDLFDETVRSSLEVKLWKLGQELLKLGQNVILENGLWSREERDDKRRDIARLDVDTQLHFFDIPFEELMRRIEIRNTSSSHGTVPLTRAQMASYAKFFQAPDNAELALFTHAVIHRPTRMQPNLLDERQKIVQTIRSLPMPPSRPLIIAVSGFGGGGKTTLASFLKTELRHAAVICIDSFSNHEWHRGPDWDNFDRNRFTKEILLPAHQNKFPLNYVHEPWPGHKADPAISVPRYKYLIVEGCSIFHPNLLEYFDYKIWTDCPLEEATRRAMWRDRYVHKNEQDYYWKNIWMPNDRDFFSKYHPDRSADIILKTNK